MLYTYFVEEGRLKGGNHVGMVEVEVLNAAREVVVDHKTTLHVRSSPLIKKLLIVIVQGYIFNHHSDIWIDVGYPVGIWSAILIDIRNTLGYMA